MNRPLVLVDLDQVIYRYTNVIADYLYSKQAMTTPPWQAYSDARSWAFWEDWDISTGEYLRWVRLGIEEGIIYGQGPLIPGARDALWKLSDAEWNIAICTYRLTQFGLHDKIIENTVNWLKDNNVPYRELIFTSDKTRIFADAIIDDVETNMSSFSHKKQFHFPSNHNQGREVKHHDQEKYWDYIVEDLIGENEEGLET